MKPTLFPITAIICSAVCHAQIPETSARGGLPNVLAKLNAGEPVRVAYLGG
ncbi:MAG: SGNH/GDSL hydrolase family protein, partial [Verrucomicrobiaceae bacterium]